ncbi:MAG TPA: asparagine synthase (glutamine-hydrolyzing) [Candidatus Thermoplasmatota archaeon]|nr:asparagine synthase (glutamine-hydrolyzing) [Candidatus Thermoplasmatota archaeon]
MCGIAGLIGGLAASTGAGRASLRGMVACLRHRGPDHEGVFEAEGVGLGHARLSIIDLSAASDQPLVDPATGAAIAFNGELYNFRGLRAHLEKAGRRFASEGDTEVLLQGYLEEGVRFFRRLNGMYAFAIWDPRTRRVVLARDPVGVKPLHYSAQADGVAFASEAKALYPFLPEFRLDPLGLAGHLRFHYPVGGRTLTAGILRFPPGEAWELDLAGKVVARHGIGPLPLEPQPVPDAKALWALLEGAVRRQMVADVPVGAFLSGGIDSSIVTALAAQASPTPLATFSVGFDVSAPAADERPAAAAFAEGLGARHRSVEVRGEDALRELGAMSWHYDGPLGEGACIPNHFVARLARQKVTVVLAGEGGDEVFGGYPRYLEHERLERLARRLPRLRPLARLATRAAPAGRKRLAWSLLHPDRAERYAALLEWMRPGQVRAAGLPVPGLGAMGPGETPLELDQRTLLRDCFLPKADATCMAHGLEERVPLLDLELVARCKGIPPAAKLGPPGKRILRDAARPTLGAVADRPKQGYGTPLTAWMEGAFADAVAGALAEPAAVAEGLVAARSWDALAAACRAPGGRRNAWLLFSLDAWVQELRRRGALR